MLLRFGLCTVSILYTREHFQQSAIKLATAVSYPVHLSVIHHYVAFHYSIFFNSINPMLRVMNLYSENPTPLHIHSLLNVL
jgi:hypothetical protein